MTMRTNGKRGWANTFAAALLAAASAAAAQPATATGAAADASSDAGDWVITEDGAAVIDVRARLVWARCVEGMRWHGKTCTGQPKLVSRAEATALATERWQAEKQDWRLPRVPELQRLIDRSLSPPGVNPQRFPAAPGGWHWSATANVSGRGANPYNYKTVQQSQNASAAQMAMLNGWAVHLSTAEARGDAARGSKLPVRLVRSATSAELPAP